MASELLEAFNKDNGSTLEKTQSKMIAYFVDKHNELKRLVKEKQEKEYELDNLTQQEWFNGSFETDVEYSVIINVINDRTELIDKLILEL